MFTIGEKVRIKYHPENRCGTVGCSTQNNTMQGYLGNITTITGGNGEDSFRLAIDLGLWVWSECMLEKINNSKTTMKKGEKGEKEQKEQKKERKRIADINFTRNAGAQVLSIKVTPELEALFKSDEISTSDTYKNVAGTKLKYYKLTPSLETYTDTFTRNEYGTRTTLNHYGTELFMSGTFNGSILRTVGLSEGVDFVVTNLILDTEVHRWTEFLAKYLKFLHQNFIEKTEIKATISIEM